MQGNRLILKQWSLDWREQSNPFLSPAKVGTFVFFNNGWNKTIWRNYVKYLQYGGHLWTFYWPSIKRGSGFYGLTMCQVLKLLGQFFHGQFGLGLHLQFWNFPQHFAATQGAQHRLSCLAETSRTKQTLNIQNTIFHYFYFPHH